MINAWSLLYEELNGTMDKTYPIENNELNNENINITTETGNTIFNVPEDVVIEDIPEIVTAGEASDEVLTIDGGDTIDFDDYPTAFTAFADNDDSIAHHIDLGIGSTASVDTLNLDFSGIEGINISSTYGDDTISFDTPTPGIEKDCTRKYKEDESIEALKNYISTTYGGHYTSDNNNVQTLDLIESVGDAESYFITSVGN